MDDHASTPAHSKPDSERLVLSGDWTLLHFTRIQRQLAKLDPNRFTTLCFDDVTRLDTAAAQLLIEWYGPARMQALSSMLPVKRKNLLISVAGAVTTQRQEPPPANASKALTHGVALVGQQVESLYLQQKYLLGFLGLVLSALARTLWRPSRWRVTATVSHIQQTGLNAVPIVMLLTFMVGAVVAFLGATVLESFGATIYTVNLVVFSFLREFGVLLAAIMLAGRTASAFTAQLGSMKSNEEIDALRTQGLDPIELLVLPRVLALWISLPLLAFIGTLSGMLGGAVVGVVALDIPLSQFLRIVERDIGVSHFFAGIVKAPLFALVIALIGCAEGFKVSGSAQSVGEHTTSSVVQSIFMVILLDALAALYFMEMGW
ncbi:MlaE family lipid ABC transporter permease subunit [Vreelandella salicampi]|uniref:ABC transporter permease n=1 Tax=Vreelandella salicampi TaxID=1449798 RepID=A0A7Z0LKW3_9GAMM|nr:ABC transporter permease [Halomonas salicampi]